MNLDPAAAPLLSTAWPLLALHLAGGVALGLLYFRGLRWTTRLFADGAPMAKLIVLMVGRFALLAAVLVATSLEGAGPLLATALGLFIARFIAVRRARGEEGRT